MKAKFHLCTCGSCRHPEWSCMKGGALKPVEFPAHFAVIEHPVHGLMLFDTGYADHIKSAAQAWPSRVYSKLLPYKIPVGEDVPTQLRRLGYATSDVKWVIISHFHPDHIAGLKDFPTAHYICSRVAWEFLHQRRGWGALKEGFLPNLLPDAMDERIIWIEDALDYPLQETLPGFSTGKDIFGCGALIAVPLPGHAIGQYGLFIQDPQNVGKEVFMVGDACWRSISYRNYILPPSVVIALMHDPEAYRATLLNLHRLSLRRNDVWIIPSHCNEIVMPINGGIT